MSESPFRELAVCLVAAIVAWVMVGAYFVADCITALRPTTEIRYVTRPPILGTYNTVIEQNMIRGNVVFRNNLMVQPCRTFGEQTNAATTMDYCGAAE